MLRIHSIDRLLIPLFEDGDLTTFSKYTPAIAEQNVIPKVAIIPKTLETQITGKILFHQAHGILFSEIKHPKDENNYPFLMEITTCPQIDTEFKNMTMPKFFSSS